MQYLTLYIYKRKQRSEISDLV